MVGPIHDRRSSGFAALAEVWGLGVFEGDALVAENGCCVRGVRCARRALGLSCALELDRFTCLQDLVVGMLAGPG